MTSLIPVLLDHQPEYFRGDPAGASLLSTEIGHTTLLEHIIGVAQIEAGQNVVVIPTFPVTRAYAGRIQHATTRDTRIVEPSGLAEWEATLESQDVVCVVDPMRQPLGIFDVDAIWRRYSFFRGATHLVLVGNSSDGVTEDLERDAAGKVRRMRRSYVRVAPPEVANTATFASFVRASALQNLVFTSAGQLRAALSYRGALMSDVPLVGETADLSEELGLLKFNEWMLENRHDDDTAASGSRGFMKQSRKSAASIHPSARLIGPVVIGEGCTVEENVTIVGPSVIGRYAQLAAGSTVVQSLVAPSAAIPPGADILHRVVVGEWNVGSRSNETNGEDVTPFFALRMRAHLDMRTSSPLSCWWGRQRRRGGAFVKRTLDVLIAGTGLLVLSPVLFIISLLIKLGSRGPIFFCHKRESLGGKEFSCLKFRTMVPDAHLRQRELYARNEVDGPQFKLARDPRITRLGCFLRRSNFDELPQLFNVLAGQMSLIGPRPSPFRENQICVSWRRARLSVRPGISGLWQICRDNREGGDFHQWIHFDLLYARHWSIWLDLKILVATVLTLGGHIRVPVEWLISPARLRVAVDGGCGFNLETRPPDGSMYSTSAA